MSISLCAATGAGRICMALRNDREILSHRGLDVVPFFQQLARGDRLGFHTEQLSGLPIIARRRLGRRGRRIHSIFDERDSFEFVGSQKGTLLASTSRPLSRWRVGRRAAVQHIPTYVLAKPIDGCVTPNPLRHRNSRTDRTRVTFSFRRKGERADRRILAGPTMWQNERFVRQAAPLLERFNL
jgi:hypothetical protein